jgi:BirA family biotin operon repressor/biotin-[acetyl-CoA-carboxylase] ligase
VDERSLNRSLSDLPLGGIRFLESTGSTNDEALTWAAAGAADCSVVIAEEQLAGRGRLDRKWFTPRGSALAFSIVLRPSATSPLARAPGLAALSIADACSGIGLEPRIKWPNDVLLGGKKIAGILIETVWHGERSDAQVIGIGINVCRESVPSAALLNYPATSIEDQLGRRPDRESLLRQILQAFITRRSQINSDSFLQTWEALLAFRGERVQVQAKDEQSLVGDLIGLAPDGSLRLRGEKGEILLARAGDLSLRRAC